jgi:hypothetical protein
LVKSLIFNFLFATWLFFFFFYFFFVFFVFFPPGRAAEEEEGGKRRRKVRAAAVANATRQPQARRNQPPSSPAQPATLNGGASSGKRRRAWPDQSKPESSPAASRKRQRVAIKVEEESSDQDSAPRKRVKSKKSGNGSGHNDGDDGSSSSSSSRSSSPVTGVPRKRPHSSTGGDKKPASPGPARKRMRTGAKDEPQAKARAARKTRGPAFPPKSAAAASRRSATPMLDEDDADADNGGDRARPKTNDMPRTPTPELGAEEDMDTKDEPVRAATPVLGSEQGDQALTPVLDCSNDDDDEEEEEATISKADESRENQEQASATRRSGRQRKKNQLYSPTRLSVPLHWGKGTFALSEPLRGYFFFLFTIRLLRPPTILPTDKHLSPLVSSFFSLSQSRMPMPGVGAVRQPGRSQTRTGAGGRPSHPRRRSHGPRTVLRAARRRRCRSRPSA